jgi:hypothetical protein
LEEHQSLPPSTMPHPSQRGKLLHRRRCLRLSAAGPWLPPGGCHLRQRRTKCPPPVCRGEWCPPGSETRQLHKQAILSVCFPPFPIYTWRNSCPVGHVCCLRRIGTKIVNLFEAPSHKLDSTRQVLPSPNGPPTQLVPLQSMVVQGRGCTK